jgi:protein TonB
MLPATLPADFSEWDGEDVRGAQAGNIEGPGGSRGSGVVPEPLARPAEAGAGTAPPAAGRSPGARTRTQAKVEAKEYRTEVKGRGKGMIIFVMITLLLLVLVALGFLGYSVLRSGTRAVGPPLAAQTETPLAARTETTTAPRPETANAPQRTATHTPGAGPTPSATLADSEQPPRVQSQMMNDQLTSPAKIPHAIKAPNEKEAPPPSNFAVAGLEGLGDTSSSLPRTLAGMGASAPKVQVAAAKKMTVSAGVATGMLIEKTTPIYPPVAKAAHLQGTVVLQATISKTGSIENLRVLSGPEQLRRAALDAVHAWRYRPFLLDNEPVEVETTISVVFTLGG